MIGSDPVEQGLVASLSRPGGNVTGLSVFNEAISGKRLQLLKELLPGLARVAVLTNPMVASHAIFRQETEATAPRLGVALQPLEVRGLDDFEAAFAAAKRGNAQVLLAFDDPSIWRASTGSWTWLPAAASRPCTPIANSRSTGV